MTVCIAALYDSNSVIGASDRMLTAGDVQFEPQQSKIVPLTSSIVAMIAGDAAMQAEILVSVRVEAYKRIDEAPNEWLAVSYVAGLYDDALRKARNKRSERGILSPLGLDLDTFVSRQKELSPALARQLATELINFSIPSVAVIFAGVDSSGPHIYVVNNNGVTCQDGVGFAAIGVGSWHADSQFMFAGHTRVRPLPETLLLTYSAKKHAEVAPGVGVGTDMFSIGPKPGSYYTVDSHVQIKLEEIYQESRRKIEQVGKDAEGIAVQYVEEITAAATVKEQPTIPEDGGGNAPADETAVRRDRVNEGQPDVAPG